MRRWGEVKKNPSLKQDAILNNETRIWRKLTSLLHSQIQQGIEWMQNKTVVLGLECRMFPKGSCVSILGPWLVVLLERWIL